MIARLFAVVLFATFHLLTGNAAQPPSAEALFEAARKGDVAAMKKVLDAGVDVNSKTEFGMTAVAFAASAGHADAIRFLAERKADLDQADTYYGATPLSWALQNGQSSAVQALLRFGAKGERGALSFAINNRQLDLLKAVLASGRMKQEDLDDGLARVKKANLPEWIALLRRASAKDQPPEPPVAPRPSATVSTSPRPASTPPKAKAPPAISVEPDGRVQQPAHWPSFRGPAATGIADGQWPPTGWDATTGRNLLWKVPIPGLGLSSPVVWGDRVFVTTAINEKQLKPSLKTGQYGDVGSVTENEPHQWKVICLAADSGRVLWEQTAASGVPKTKRHTKSSHANPTPACDGTHLAVSFGSEGLFSFTVEGKLLWKKDFGKLTSGWFFHPDYEWGFGSSPILFEGLLIAQVDVGKDSFIAAFRADDGTEVWRTAREELPSWGTPTVVQPANGPPELVTLGTKFARGYDPKTGSELWRVGKFSDITVPTPFLSSGLIFVCSGYRPVQPIFAIKPGSRGDLSLKDKKEASEHVAWSKQRGGPYMPTPIGYGDHLYVCANSGVLTCLEAKTGKQVYQQRLGGGNGYTASPVAADGRLYFTDEEGVTRVVKAGAAFELLAQNQLGEECLATPAISNGTIFLRGREHLFAFRRGIAGKNSASEK